MKCKLDKAFYEYDLDGKKIKFHHSNIIKVELGKGKSSYKTKWSFEAKQFSNAVFYFNCLNIGNGYKKRLVCNELNKPLLARAFS